MSPPGVAPAASARWNHVGEGDRGEVGHALVQQLIAVARKDPRLDCVSTNRISRLIRGFIAAKLHERDLVSWLISYADPTGETAVRNVLRERGR